MPGLGIFCGKAKSEAQVNAEYWLKTNLDALVSAINQTDNALKYQYYQQLHNRAKIILQNQSFLNHEAAGLLSSNHDLVKQDCTSEQLREYLFSYSLITYFDQRKIDENKRCDKFASNAHTAVISMFYLGLALFVLLAFSYLLFSIIAGSLHNPALFIPIAKLILTYEFFSMIGFFGAAALTLPAGFLVNKRLNNYNHSSINSLQIEYKKQFTDIEDNGVNISIITREIDEKYAEFKAESQQQKLNSVV